MMKRGSSYFRGSLNSRGSVSSVDDVGGYGTPDEEEKEEDVTPTVRAAANTTTSSSNSNSNSSSNNNHIINTNVNGGSVRFSTVPDSPSRGDGDTVNFGESNDNDNNNNENKNKNGSIMKEDYANTTTTTTGGGGGNSEISGEMDTESNSNEAENENNDDHHRHIHHHHHKNNNNNPEMENSINRKVRKIRHATSRGFRVARRTLGHSLPERLFRKYPRTWSCCCGILLPIWILVLISLILGLALGHLEYDGEVESNDEAMKTLALQKAFNTANNNLITSLSSICLLLYRNATDTSNETNETLFEIVDNAFESVRDKYNSFDEFVQNSHPSLRGFDVVNLTNFAIFIDTCGQVGNKYSTDLEVKYFGDNVLEAGEMDTSLSFSWIRCANRTDIKAYNRIFSPNERDLNASRPGRQAAWYTYSWNEDQQRLQDLYFDEYMEQNNDTSIADANFEAFARSVDDATGSAKCSVNVASAAWFWFTIMTTVGYGNQAPASVGGRFLTGFLGFFSIIYFAAVLTSAGQIVAYVVSDCLNRLKWRIIARKEVMVTIWGLLWIVWMGFLGYMFSTWEDYRLGDEINGVNWYTDGIWWAFISSSTIGLGDYYPAPEVLFIADLLAFSLSFLFGFVLLSSFLTEMGLLLTQYVPDMSIELGNRLKYVGVTKYFEEPSSSESLDDSEGPRISAPRARSQRMSEREGNLSATSGPDSPDRTSG